MSSTNYPPALPPRSPYLFVDGANATKTIVNFVDRYWPGERSDIDWNKLARTFHKVFVYDALPVKRDEEAIEAFADKLSVARRRLARISRAPDTHVRTGLSRAEGVRGTLRQKGVDIQLTVDALTMAHQGAYSEAVIWTSDLDFLPLFEQLVMMGVRVTLWHPPDITTEALRMSADRTSEVTPSQLYALMGDLFQNDHSFPGCSTHQGFVPWDGTILAQWNVDGKLVGHIMREDKIIAAVWHDYLPDTHLQIRGKVEDFDIILKLGEDQYQVEVPIGSANMARAALVSLGVS